MSDSPRPSRRDQDRRHYVPFPIETTEPAGLPAPILPRPAALPPAMSVLEQRLTAGLVLVVLVLAVLVLKG